MKIKLSCAITLAVALIATLTTLNSYAQDAAEDKPRTASSLVLEEVVVTAEKRDVARSVQVVPIAVNVMSGETMDAFQMTNVYEVGLTQPNVRLQSVGSVPGVANFSIRGIGFNSSVPSDEPTVGIIVDGVPLTVTYGAYLDTFDLESVEILRGPQGTLFGRNSTGGAISLRSRRPNDEFEAKARIIAGSQERLSFSGSIGGALSGEQVLGKLAISIEDRDGYFTNGAIPGDKVGERDSVFVRPILVFRPNENLDVTLIGEYGDIDGDGVIIQLTDREGDLPYRLGFRRGDDDHLVFSDPEGKDNSNWYQLTSEINWTVGPGNLTSITGYRDSELTLGEAAASGPQHEDHDGTPINLFNIQIAVAQQQFSQELRYAGSAMDDRLAYTAGMLYLQQDLEFQESRLIAGAFGAAPIATQSALDQESFGVFGQLEYEFSHGIFGLVGGRYSSDKKDVEISSFGECNADYSNCPVGFRDGNTFDAFSPKVGLRWEASENVNTYATYTKGFRSGGYNFRNTVPGTPGPYGDESVTAYEIGIKSELADGRVRGNLAVFRNEYDDIQRTVLVSATEQNIKNAASATIQGVELDVSLTPVDNLVITGAVGVLDAKFNEFNGLDVNGDGNPDPELAVQLDLERAPEWTYSLMGIYDIPLSNNALVTLRGSYSFTDKTPIDTLNRSYVDEYKLLNASVSYAFANGRTTITAFGKNLADEVYGVTGADVPGFLLIHYLEAPRTWGVEVNFTY